MNRTIKFRVWDKIWKEYLSQDETCIFGDGILCGGELDDLRILKQENYEIQYFTGITDMNGTKIYDGDLIKADGYGPYRVFWNNGSWCSCIYRDSEPLSMYHQIEVVGHVYAGIHYEGEQ